VFSKAASNGTTPEEKRNWNGTENNSGSCMYNNRCLLVIIRIEKLVGDTVRKGQVL
jgi:hypothetical protein